LSVDSIFLQLERSASVNSSKYIGMDVHTATISVAVRDAAGKLIIAQDDLDRIAHKNACLLYPTVAARAGYVTDSLRSAW
jgi:hypothetical protein